MAQDNDRTKLSAYEKKQWELMVEADDMQKLQQASTGLKGSLKKPIVQGVLLFAAALAAMVAGMFTGVGLFAAGNIVGVVIAIAGFAVATVLAMRGYTLVDGARHPERLLVGAGSRRRSTH